VLGGQSAYNTPLASDLEYDPATNKWTNITSLPASRYSGVGGVFGTNKFVYTGGSGSTFSATTYIGTWS